MSSTKSVDNRVEKSRINAPMAVISIWAAGILPRCLVQRNRSFYDVFKRLSLTANILPALDAGDTTTGTNHTLSGNSQVQTESRRHPENFGNILKVDLIQIIRTL